MNKEYQPDGLNTSMIPVLSASKRQRVERPGSPWYYFTFLLLTFIVTSSYAQTDSKKYLVLLKDKGQTPYNLDNPSQFLSPRSVQRRLKQNIPLTVRDLPVDPAYVEAVKTTGAQVWFTSRWLNAVMVQTDAATLQNILQLPFVKGLEGKTPLNQSRRESSGRTSGRQSLKGTMREQNLPLSTESVKKDTPSLVYGPSLDQVAMIGADQMHSRGFRGEGMLVAILDAGFRDANKLTHFQHLFADNRVLSTYDFVHREAGVYEDDSHGAHVLGAMAGYTEGKLIGTAFKASYILLRTEDASSETRTEEANWLMAAEYADSAGVDVINSSLGYTTFDDAAQNYAYADLDGDKALVTRAADWAASVGILVVNSAGNEGANFWQYVSAPADADSIIAVGSVNKDRQRAFTSSKGPTADRRIKPDLAALGQGAVVSTSASGIITSSGTSFASPVLAGLATGFWQAFPQLNNMQVIDYLKRSASQYSRPDSLLGYGIPNFVKAADMADLAKNLNESSFVFPNPIGTQVDPKVWLGTFPKNQLYTATLTDAIGKQLWTGPLANELNTLPLSTLQLAPGYYFLRVVSESGATFSAKLLKL